jgi:hypothetical protein
VCVCHCISITLCEGGGFDGVVWGAAFDRFRRPVLHAACLFCPLARSPVIESTLAEYSNFRYYSELLGSDVLPPAYATAVMDFRETHTGSVSGITRWSDHLDDMPALVRSGWWGAVLCLALSSCALDVFVFRGCLLYHCGEG